MSKKIVVVLEDDWERISWLTGMLIGYEVIATDRVSEFLVNVETHRADLAMVVFDRDLGRGPPGWMDKPESETRDVLFVYDEDGKTGEDAAKGMNYVPVPVLVWSHNIEGSRAIANILKVRDVAPQIRRERFEPSKDYAEMVLTLVRGYRSR